MDHAHAAVGEGVAAATIATEQTAPIRKKRKHQQLPIIVLKNLQTSKDKVLAFSAHFRLSVCVGESPISARHGPRPDEQATLGISGLAKLKMHINAEKHQLEIEEEEFILED